MAGSRWMSFIFESAVAVVMGVLFAGFGLSIFEDVGTSPFALVSVYTLGLSGYLLFVWSAARRWTDAIEERYRTRCCHSGATRMGPVLRCNVCLSLSPDVYDSEANDSVTGVAS